MAALRSNVMLSLGIITVPVAVQTAVSPPTEAQLNTLCHSGHPPTRTRQDLKCPACGNAERGSFVKGKEVGKDTFVLIDAATVEAAGPSEAVRNTLALTIHPADEVSSRTLSGGKVYFLAPGKAAGESYALLVELVRKRTDVAFCTEFAVRSVAAMYRVGTFADALTLTELAWPEAVKAAPASDATLNPAMLPLAEQFVDTLTTPFDPATYRDTRTATLAAFIAGGDAITAAPSQPVATVTSLEDLLKAAVAATKPVKRTRRPKEVKAS
jgi:DNA end-binding protein Ku